MIDVGPTILDVAGIPEPSHADGIEREPMHGFTFADSLANTEAPERHAQQYFEAVGNRTMYTDGWWLAMRLPHIPWLLDPEALRHFGPGWDPDADPVELYYLPDDFSQARDLAGEHPDKVEEVRKLFWGEAERYDHPHADAVTRVLTNAIRTATTQIDEASPNPLKGGLQAAAAGLEG